MMPNFKHLPITPMLKIQQFPSGMLIFRQKTFQVCTLRLKAQQSVLPYLWAGQYYALVNSSFSTIYKKISLLRKPQSPGPEVDCGHHRAVDHPLLSC